ncbi:MAG: YifB family Mg chelatase-like AAA ATPase [Lachnospiraceae bacterium]
MFSKVLSAAIIGVEAIPVQVEADVSNGLPGFVMVGYLSTQVREAQDRIRASFRNAGISVPPKKITINLSPADVRKEGSRFDIPIAAAVLAACGLIPERSTEGVVMVGELSLNGRVNRVNGILATVMRAKQTGASACVVPMDNYCEATLIDGITIVGINSMNDLVNFLRFGEIPSSDSICDKKGGGFFAGSFENDDNNSGNSPDFSNVKGQEFAKRAAVIAAAGYHNMLMTGPPGSGKSMIASRIPTILPGLSRDECLEITQIYSVAGKLKKENPIITERPFRAPHHTITGKALTGGGIIPVPGEVTLAHRGVLFLDEIPEFGRNAIEVLRVPLEEKKVTVTRMAGACEFPANFLLIAARNPCPCGYYPDMNRCKCTSQEIMRYQNRISHPVLDRIDIHVRVEGMKYDDISNTYDENSEKNGARMSSNQMRATVSRAYSVQKKRFEGSANNIHFNSEIPSSLIGEYCPLSDSAEKVLREAFEKMKLSARSYHRIIKVARTIADIEASFFIEEEHVMEALMYRNGY